MLVAIDYDETISANPAAWVRVIGTLKDVGFSVICVTYRQPDCDPHELAWLNKHVEEIIFTGEVNKKGFCNAAGYHVDVWIDDEPLSITHDYGLRTNWKWVLPQ